LNHDQFGREGYQFLGQWLYPVELGCPAKLVKQFLGVSTAIVITGAEEQSAFH
jgi:hypothetical protein